MVEETREVESICRRYGYSVQWMEVGRHPRCSNPMAEKCTTKNIKVKKKAKFRQPRKEGEI